MNNYIKYCFSDKKHPPELFTKDVKHLETLLQDKTLKRVKSFTNSNLEIYPQKNIYQYTVISHKKDGHNIKEVEINKKDHYTNCTCEDNFYREIECKHIWGVRLFSKYKALPEPGQSRIIWYLNKLQKLKEKINNPKQQKILKFTIQNIKENDFKHQNIQQVSKIIVKYSETMSQNTN